MFFKKWILSLLCWSYFVFICLKGIQEHFFEHQCQTVFCLQMGWMLAVLWVLPRADKGAECHCVCTTAAMPGALWHCR